MKITTTLVRPRIWGCSIVMALLFGVSGEVMAQTAMTWDNVPTVRFAGPDRPLSWSLAKEWSLSGAGNDGLLLSRVSPSDLAILPNGRIVLLDRLGHKVYYISPSGALLDSVGRSGKGPGEFLRALNVTLDSGNNVAVLDRDKRAFVRWSPAGDPLQEISLNPLGTVVGTGAAIVSGAFVYKTLHTERDGSSRYRLLLTDGGETALLAAAPPFRLRTASFPSCRLELTVAPLLLPSIPWHADGTRVAAAPDASYSILIFRNNLPAMRIERTLPLQRITPAMAVKEAESLRIDDCRVPANEAARAFGYADVLAAVSGIRFAPAGEIWVRRGTIKGEAERIDIFGAVDGRYVGTLLNVPFPALFLTADRVLTISTDELDVPTITAWRVQRR